MRLASVAIAIFLLGAGAGYRVKEEHPRIFVDDVSDLARRVAGPLAEDYEIVKDRADAAVRRGRVELGNKWAVPDDLMNLGLAYLVERKRGRKHRKYADAILATWGDGRVIANREGSNFGYHAVAFDWIFDAMTKEERRRYGDALGSWLDWYTGRPEITLKWGHWEYNQTWGPTHLNVMNSRDAITAKLLVSLAILGAGTRYEKDARRFLDSWHERIPSECVPAFNRMGGVWSESYGHGAYGPVTVIPYAFRAWRSATGIDLLRKVKPWGYPAEEPRWVAYTMMPMNERTAWIDDGNGARPGAFARAAPMLPDGLSRWFADRGREWLRERWQRVACLDPTVAPIPPSTLPLAYLFTGAGHVYMRSAWDDPNSTWAFFGAGPQFAGHSRDDEGHFLIAKRGSLVSRQGGQGHNDDDHYAGGSLIYNIVTIFDPEERFRRARGNENDGGIERHVYEGGPFPRERGRIVAYEHTDDYTYAAADLTKAYASRKTREVTRQFLYLRAGAKTKGRSEFFVVFDRVRASKPEYRRHFFLHVPTRPEATGGALGWTSLPSADGDDEVLSTGRSRMFLTTLLPKKAELEIRGGPGKEAWGHPLEPTAQRNHDSKGRRKPPICPWRIEVGDPGPGASTLFLHVFEIAEEGARRPAAVKFVPPAGVEIQGRTTVRFNARGSLGGRVGARKLTTEVRTESQYR